MLLTSNRMCEIYQARKKRRCQYSLKKIERQSFPEDLKDCQPRRHNKKQSVKLTAAKKKTHKKICQLRPDSARATAIAAAPRPRSLIHQGARDPNLDATAGTLEACKRQKGSWHAHSRLCQHGKQSRTEEKRNISSVNTK